MSDAAARERKVGEQALAGGAYASGAMLKVPFKADKLHEEYP